MKMIRRFSDLSKKAVENEVLVDAIVEHAGAYRLAKSKYEENVDQELEAIDKEMDKAVRSPGG